MSQPKSDTELVEAYLRHYAEKDDSLFWAWQQLQDYLSSDPARAWSLTLKLIAAAPTPEALSYIGAGPLEDLLYGRGEQFIDEVERLARQDPKFRRALQGVYNESESPGDVHDRVNKAAADSSK
jgi:ABC-type nitrate/sulfonate/bicarbonate transport system substrate-binding protein